MNHISKVLPIREVKDITLFTHHLLMLQIPMMECGLEDWWMSNFINVHYRYENPTFYEYTDFEIFYKNMFDDTKLTFEDSRHFNDPEHFTEFIEQDKYIYAWIDNYYLGASVHYQKRHDIHPILIYGYDNERQIYYIKGFDVERSLFEAEAEYQHVHTALQKAREKNIRLNNEESVLIIKPQYFMKRFTWDYAYQYNRVLSELYDYITGRGKLDGLYFTIREDRELYEQNHSAYGLNVTELFRTYYSGMNCFLVRGVLKYYQNEPDLFPLVESHCSWVISYTTGTSVSGGFWTGPAVPDSRLVFEYSRNNISWDSTKTVTEIRIDHNLFANDNPCAYLYSVYTPE